jgi:uncharacterized coiled-coil protein SlyX
MTPRSHDAGRAVPRAGPREARIVELELRFTEQQRMLQELSDVVYAQGRALERLEHELAAARQKLAVLEPGLVDPTAVERPPHF